MTDTNTGYPKQAGGYPQSYPPQQGYSPQQPATNVVIRQSQVQPNDYLVFAIIVTILCCLPLGIVAIIKSSEVRNRFAAGDYAGAEQASNEAKNWSIAGLVTGIVLSVIVVIIYVIMGAAAASSYQY